MVCNNGTDYRCICRAAEPPDTAEPVPGIIECDEFIQSLELPVVDMRLRHVNLEAHLHTNEKYETYFKRRIANIVSSYCEHQADECPGTTLRLTQTSSDASQSDDDNNGDDKSVLYAADDESEPLLTQNNVVLLRVEREPVNVTRILFAITKSENVGSLNEQMIIDPVKVKYILGSQAGPLARILGESSSTASESLGYDVISNPPKPITHGSSPSSPSSAASSLSATSSAPFDFAETPNGVSESERPQPPPTMPTASPTPPPCPTMDHASESPRKTGPF